MHRSLSRADVEQLALRLYRWRLHLDDPESYWITGMRVAAALGVNEARLRVLAAKDYVPCETHADGTRMHPAQRSRPRFPCPLSPP